MSWRNPETKWKELNKNNSNHQPTAYWLQVDMSCNIWKIGTEYIRLLVISKDYLFNKQFNVSLAREQTFLEKCE